MKRVNWIECEGGRVGQSYVQTGTHPGSHPEAELWQDFSGNSARAFIVPGKV